MIKFRALCIYGTRLTSARRLPRPRIWVLGRDIYIDGNQDGLTCTTSRDLLYISGGLVTRVRVKKMREVLNGLIEQIWVDNNMQ
ncbi:hypothetical protein SLEP1_g15168 [Rubroshorea leprosula]|uniref:Uncharacterized protein n=1 Tax=Rubroshorea leprosula TaxID=152421 RepID=A0AAV5IUB4_9ROSI|nr:hypothetical protein SLEP1_g15168 [Rubroshorea leprosula]